jgi:hypothetical protein
MVDMADERREGQIPNRISDAELRELLATGGFLVACHFCGHREWTLLNQAYEISPFLPADSVGTSELPRRVDCAVLLCKVCGFMQLHERGLFYRLLEALRARRDARQTPQE